MMIFKHENWLCGNWAR